jgi:hypothetical protein
MLLRLGAIGVSQSATSVGSICQIRVPLSSLSQYPTLLKQYMHSQRFDSRDGHVCGTWCKIPVGDVQHSAWKGDALG